MRGALFFQVAAEGLEPPTRDSRFILSRFPLGFDIEGPKIYVRRAKMLVRLFCLRHAALSPSIVVDLEVSIPETMISCGVRLDP